MNYGQLAQAGNILTQLGTFQNFQSKRDIITVNSLNEAKDFKLNNGESVVLMDSNDDIIYVKQCDEIGKVSLNVYRCTNITEEFEKQNTPANVSKADFDALVQSISELKSMVNKGGNKNEHNA